MTSTPSGSSDFGTSENISPEVIADRYEVVRVLGEDRLGRKYEVRDRQVKEHRVALSLLWPDLSSAPGFKEEFFRRADLAQSIVGEHVNRVVGSGTESAMEGKEQLYLTTSLEDGETLRDRLEREDTLGPRQAIEIARQVLMALSDGHEKNLVHGNLRPCDVVLTRGVPKTPENPFGINVKVHGLGVIEPPATEEEDPEAAVYVAPEKVEGKPLDARSDLFSVGMLLVEALIGARTFQSGEGEEIQQAVLARDMGKLAHLLEDVEPSIRRRLLKALSRNREMRFSSAREFRSALEALPAFREPTRTSGVVKLAVVLFLFAGLGGSLYGLWAKGEAGTARRLLDQRTGEFEGKIQKLETTVGDVEELKSQSKKDSEKIQELEGELEKARSEPGPVAAVDEGTAGQSSDARAARAFDVFLKLIEERRLDSVALMGTLDARSPLARGKRFLTSLEHSVRALEEAGHASDDNVRQYLLGRARFALEDARKERELFAGESESWLEYAPEGAEAPDRLARLDKILTGLGESLKTGESGTTPVSPAGAQDEAWVRILAAGPEQDPAEAFQLAVGEDGSVDGRLLRLAESYVAGLRTRVIRGNDLDRDALSRESRLQAWTQLLGESETARKWPVSRDIRLLAYARSFFGGEETGAVPWGEVFQPTAGAPSDWRLDLYLRSRVIEKWPWLLPGTKHTSVYTSRTSDGSVTFRQTKLAKPPEEGQCVFTVAVYDEAGDRIASQESVVNRSGGVCEWSGIRIDPVQGKAKIEKYEPGFLDISVPRQAGANEEELKRFADDLRKLGPVESQCLVFETGGATVYLSPKLGLVRFDREGTVQELVYLNITSLDD